MTYSNNPTPRYTPDYIVTNPNELRTQVLEFPDPNVTQVYQKHGITYTWSGTHWEANNAKALDERFAHYDIGTYGELP